MLVRGGACGALGQPSGVSTAPGQPPTEAGSLLMATWGLLWLSRAMWTEKQPRVNPDRLRGGGMVGEQLRDRKQSRRMP